MKSQKMFKLAMIACFSAISVAALSQPFPQNHGPMPFPPPQYNPHPQPHHPYQEPQMKGNYEGTVCEFGGQIATVLIHNTTPYPITVRLWHPDTNSVATIKHVDGHTTMYLGDGFRVGDDWGVQMGSSSVRCMGNAAYIDEGSFVIEP